MRRDVPNYTLAVLGTWLLLDVTGCTHVPIYRADHATTIKTFQAFEAFKRTSEQPKDDKVQLAGRIIRSEVTPNGVSILAEWLPFPELPYSGPESLSTGQLNRRFYLKLSGTVDYDGRRKGNEFLMVGRFQEMQDMVTAQGFSLSIPQFTVSCLHVWKTAGTDLVEFIWMDPLDESYPPPLVETYCVPSRAF